MKVFSASSWEGSATFQSVGASFFDLQNEFKKGKVNSPKFLPFFFCIVHALQCLLQNADPHHLPNTSRFPLSKNGSCLQVLWKESKWKGLPFSLSFLFSFIFLLPPSFLVSHVSLLFSSSPIPFKRLWSFALNGKKDMHGSCKWGGCSMACCRVTMWQCRAGSAIIKQKRGRRDVSKL